MGISELTSQGISLRQDIAPHPVRRDPLSPERRALVSTVYDAISLNIRRLVPKGALGDGSVILSSLLGVIERKSNDFISERWEGDCDTLVDFVITTEGILEMFADNVQVKEIREEISHGKTQGDVQTEKLIGASINQRLVRKYMQMSSPKADPMERDAWWDFLALTAHAAKNKSPWGMSVQGLARGARSQARLMKFFQQKGAHTVLPQENEVEDWDLKSGVDFVVVCGEKIIFVDCKSQLGTGSAEIYPRKSVICRKDIAAESLRRARSESGANLPSGKKHIYHYNIVAPADFYDDHFSVLTVPEIVEHEAGALNSLLH